MARVKKFNPIDKRADKKRDFYGPLVNPSLPPQAKKKKLDKSFKEGYG